jgi:hypothetical protein
MFLRRRFLRSIKIERIVCFTFFGKAEKTIQRKMSFILEKSILPKLFYERTFVYNLPTKTKSLIIPLKYYKNKIIDNICIPYSVVISGSNGRTSARIRTHLPPPQSFQRPQHANAMDQAQRFGL